MRIQAGARTSMRTTVDAWGEVGNDVEVLTRSSLYAARSYVAQVLHRATAQTRDADVQQEGTPVLSESVTALRVYSHLSFVPERVPSVHPESVSDRPHEYPCARLRFHVYTKKTTAKTACSMRSIHHCHFLRA